MQVQMDVIFIIGIFLSFFQFILLLLKKHKSLPDKILAIWMSCIGIHLLSYYLYYLGYWKIYPHLVGVTLPFPLLHGPMLYLYTLYSLRPDKYLNKIDFFHFAPVILLYLYMVRFFFYYSVHEKIMVDNGQIDDFSLFSIFSIFLFIISGLTYPLLSYRLLGKHKQMLDDNFSYNERINLNWLKYCIWGIGLVFFTSAIVILLREGMGVDFGFNADLIFYSMVIGFVFCIGFFGIRHQDMFADNAVNTNIKLVENKSQKEYRKSGLKKEEAIEAHNRLIKIMTKEKPYIEPKLSLRVLAEMLDISTNHLSQIINQFENVNFHEFVNKYRIEEFKKRININPEFNILAHAFDSGFNSKSSFNSVFKKHLGMTPSQYMSSVINVKE